VSALLPRPTAPTRAAASRPSACRSVTRPSSPFSSPESRSRASRPSTSRSSPSAAPASTTGSRTAKTRTSASTPPGGASTTSMCMSEAGCYRSGAAAPFEGSAGRSRGRAEGRGAASPLPQPHLPPRANTSPIEALLLEASSGVTSSVLAGRFEAWQPSPQGISPGSPGLAAHLCPFPTIADLPYDGGALVLAATSSSLISRPLVRRRGALWLLPAGWSWPAPASRSPRCAELRVTQCRLRDRGAAYHRRLKFAIP
jgi:hypothetical protein